MQCPNHPRDMDCLVDRCRKCEEEAKCADNARGVASVKQALRDAGVPPRPKTPTQRASVVKSRSDRLDTLRKLIDGGDRR